MLSDTQSQVFHDFLTRLCSADYLFGLAWHGSLTTPSHNELGKLHYFAIVSDQFNVQSIRTEIAKFCQKRESAELESDLTILHQKSAARYFMLNPELAQRIEEFGWQSRLGWLGMIRSAAQQRSCDAWMGQRLMRISADLLKQPPQFERLNGFSEQKPAANFADGLKRYARLFESQPFISNESSSIDGSSSPYLFPAPVAIYRKLDQIILVTHKPLETINRWDSEAFGKYAKQFEAIGVEICTPQQLVMVVQQFGGLDVRLRRYHHIWGDRLLNNLTFSQTQLLTNAAENGAHWQVELIGRQLFARPPDPVQDRLLIHDLQNQLLNIRLQNEILSGLNILPKGKPESNLPDKTLPIEERLDIILGLFDWWANFYFAQSRASQA